MDDVLGQINWKWVIPQYTSIEKKALNSNSGTAVFAKQTTSKKSAEIWGGQNLRPFKSNKNQLFNSYNKAEYIVEDILLLND